jgi:N-acetylmuramoyl-L-alanine amidase
MRGISHLACVALCAVCFAVSAAYAQDSAASTQAVEAMRSAQAGKHILAGQQFARAESMRSDLESQPAANRTEKSYLAVVDAYRRVYYITSHADEDPAAVFAVGSLYRAMGDRFNAKYYQSAVDTYQFLLHDYPTNRYREDAMLAVGEIERDNLHDSALAKKTFQEFLTMHPHSDGAAEARQAIANIDAGVQSKPSPASAAATTAPPPSESAQQTPPSATAGNAQTGGSESDSSTGGTSSSSNAKIAEVTRIRTWNADTYTRIVIDVGAPVKYQAARIPGPDRIYFDLDGAHLDHSLLDKSIDVEPGGFLKTVRAAQYQNHVVRVVLEVNQVKNYSVFLLDHPSRIIVDVYGKAAPESQLVKNSAPTAPADSTPTTSEQASASVPTDVRQPSSSTSTDHSARTSTHTPSRTAANPAAPTTTTTDTATPAVTPATSAMPHPIAKRTTRTAATLRPPSIPEPMRDGQASLTRVLGLKVGRIVIDAGHGGHDTGTIGPTGLLEKDLCLDVALRLGALISERLPGAEVIYTRDDDTFIPLEQRTAIATQSKADLFISIHANSSPDPSARGIETYYLNFTNSPSALAAAARENATFDGGVHDLQDLLRKIALNEKIDESREFAEDIQDSLSRRMERTNAAEKNRGVRTAPFAVLIGANIPSVLAEIGFISNPTDEQLMKKEEVRERVAEGLYTGIASYLQSTNSLTDNQAPTGQSALDAPPLPLARAGNRR